MTHQDQRPPFPPAPKEEKVTFRSADTVPTRLEGRLFRGDKKTGAVICHPHPLHGGTMYNKVVDAALRGLSESGMSTLRFNFRGVMNSEGSHGDGIDEVQDLEGAIHFLKTEMEIERLFLAGFSFGTGVISRFMDEFGEADGILLIAPPVDKYGFLSFESPTLWGTSMILGELDEFCSVESFHNYKTQLGNVNKSAVVEGADHFFHGHLPKIIQLIRDILDDAEL